MLKISVKAARVNSKKTAKEAAKELGLSITAYSRKENGHVRFYVDEVIKLSQLFKVPIENFHEAGCLPETQSNTGIPLEK
ncbi:helix-turn-helix transcriptional regulator [Paenibacillus sp. S150]|uniref:helix-turn-helix transcriptional regulator n=1 Tax=Paenibacillus sp. S150 TaxID=2749826 RepID=UPI001C55EDCF|nr:helix-turn-helix transcriptional regulator [Paenibacillus sp. S150]MBW4083568.1 helix-turn-helix transcriptional regulator [Paenibacillus sp. S150]